MNGDLVAFLVSDDTLERIAATEHERWSHWQQYLHEQCRRLDDGSLVIPSELAVRWETQMKTPYSELSEREKDSDREQAREYIAALKRAASSG